MKVWLQYTNNTLIIDCDNLSHCLACTCMFASVSQIDSESVMTDTEFEESLRISEINITHSPYVFYSYNTFYPRPFPLFLTYYICPCLLTSLSMSTFIIFFSFAVCLHSAHSIFPGKAVWGEHVPVNNGGGQLPLTRCVWWPASSQCVCGQGVLLFSSSIIQCHAFSVSTTKSFQIMAPRNQMLIDTHAPAHSHTS